MTEAARGATAGALLRAARESRGLHIAALAAAIKVAPRKLDALEGDRYAELPGATFTRALAQTVCRSLRIDPQPVLAMLPQADVAELDHVGGRLNTPFRDRPARESAGLAAAATGPLVWAGAALLVAAAVTWFLPTTWFSMPQRLAASTVSAVATTPAGALPSPAAPGPPAQSTATVPVAQDAASAAAATQVEITYTSPSAQAQSSAPAVAGMLQLITTESSWIEVRDAGGRVLFSRTVLPGEAVGLDGALPLRLTVGNAAVTQASFRGRPIDLASTTRDNVARVELN